MLQFSMFVVFCIVGVVAMFAIMTVVFWHIWDTKTRNQRFDAEANRVQHREDMRFQLEMMKEYGVNPNAMIQPQIPAYPPMYPNQHTQYPTQVYEIPSTRELVRR